jgi:SAM-dependent methyltransferase
MNFEFPPLALQPPTVKARRRERRGFDKPPPLTPEERRAISARWQQELREIDTAVRELAPETMRNIVLKVTANRRLTKADLAGTGFTFMSPPSDKESLIVPRDPTKLEKLEQRILKFAEGDEVARPPGSDLATAVEQVSLADPLERLSEPLLANYQRLIGQDYVVYELEVASFAKMAVRARREVEQTIIDIHESLGRGVHGSVFEHDIHGRGARAVLWSTGAKFREFVESPQWWRRITFFDERPRFETFSEVFSNFNIADVTLLDPPDNAETICVIDTGVAAGNPFLEPVLNRDDSRSFIGGFSATEDGCGHGSGVASLAAYYQLETARGGVNRAEARIVSARIADDSGQFDVPLTADAIANRTAEARLLSNVLREIVEHYAPGGIKIFVLAFQIIGHLWGEATRRAIARSAWVARTLDQLSRIHDVVFVTITGNIAPADVADLLGEADYPKYLVRPLAKLHDPGQAALAITVGSVAHTATVAVAPMLSIALQSQPSPFTRSGPGFGESIKPDVVERGGNLVRDPQSGAVSSNLATDILMASNALTPPMQRSHGTSFAAPRVAHRLAMIARDLRVMGVPSTNPLLRALLVASADRPADSEVLDAEGNCEVIGHGLPDATRLTDCAGNSVLLYWNGDLPVDATALFNLYVPPELQSAGRGGKRIVVCVASQPAVQQWGVEEYIGVSMKFRLFRGDQDIDQIQALLQREAGEQNVAADKEIQAREHDSVLGVSRRSFGSIQRDSFEWRHHKTEYSQNDYVLAVSLKPASWVRDDDVVSLAVVVRIEDTTGKYQELYAQVRAKVRVPVRARAR